MTDTAMVDMNAGTIRTWQVSHELRWFCHENSKCLLQQKWVCHETGEIEWKTVPEVT
jgi:hypothetical protein